MAINQVNKNHNQIPQVKYILDPQSKKSIVQINASEWENFVNEFIKMNEMLKVKKKLKTAISEVHQIQNGNLKAVSLDEFLNEL